MDTLYDELLRKARGLAFIIGPGLLFIAALVNAAGIGRNPNGLDSYVEGAIGLYAMPLFIPIWLTLAGVVGRQYPRFGIGLAAFGMMSAAAGAVPMGDRMLQKGLTDRGLDLSVWDLTQDAWMAAVIIPTAPMFPLVAALIGVGLLLTRSVERWTAIALIVAMPLFYMAQAGGVAVPVTWTLATALYLVALAPLGWRIITRGSISPANEPDISVAPATP